MNTTEEEPVEKRRKNIADNNLNTFSISKESGKDAGGFRVEKGQQRPRPQKGLRIGGSNFIVFHHNHNIH